VGGRGICPSILEALEASSRMACSCQTWRSKPSRRASLEGARALLERARGRQSADRSGVNVIGARDIGHRLARGEARNRDERSGPGRVLPPGGLPFFKFLESTLALRGP